MVAKITNGSSLYGALAYNQNKVDAGTARIISSNRIAADIDNSPGGTMHNLMLSFEDYLSANTRTEKPIVHISLNPDPQDRLSDEQYSELAKEYMQRMGFGDQPYVVYLHEDIDRKHIHIVTTRIDEKGKRISDSYEHRRSVNTDRQLEIMFGLKQISDKEAEAVAAALWLKKVDYAAGDVKRQIGNTLRSVIKDYRYQTFGEFSALLSCFNIDVKQVKIGDEGDNEARVAGLVYSATDGKGNIVGTPFKSSLFGKAFGHEALEKRFLKNQEDFKAGAFAPAPAMTSVIAKAMLATAGQIASAFARGQVALLSVADQAAFAEQFHDKGIDMVFRRNEQGRIYGVTFIDHNRREVYNGSRLGKEFSANTFNDLFSGKLSGQAQSALLRLAAAGTKTEAQGAATHARSASPPPPAAGTDKSRAPATRERPPIPTTPEPSTVSTVLSAIEDVLAPGDSFQHHGPDYQEEAFARLMRKKKKHKKKTGRSL